VLPVVADVIAHVNGSTQNAWYPATSLDWSMVIVVEFGR
jgi:hypothetical protein